MTKKSYYNAIFHLSTLTFIPLSLVSPWHGKAQRENQTHRFEIRVSAGGGKSTIGTVHLWNVCWSHHKPTHRPHQMRSYYRKNAICDFPLQRSISALTRNTFHNL